MNASPRPVERDVTPTEATKRVTTALDELGITPELTNLCPGDDLTAWSCRLLTKDRAWPALARGMGKGRRDEARTGAVFEAFEHYLTGPYAFDPAAVEPAESARLAAGPLGRDACSLLLTRTPGRRLACHRYRSMTIGHGRAGSQEAHPGILVPLFLSSPWFPETEHGRLRALASDDYDYADAMRYSCNSGSAIGVTTAEALVHAINEVIERDALSLLLVRAFLRTGGFRLAVIDPSTLPREAATAHATAERLTGSPVFLLDITSDLGVPTMLAYTPPSEGRSHWRGTGTSLSPAHAVWRALTELIQTAVGEPLWRAGGSPRGDLSGLAAYPALLRCGRFDLTEHLRHARTVRFTPSGRLPGPAAQLRRLISIVVAHGYRPYERTVATLRGGITAVHVIVPGLERFMLVADGNLVVPGPRGRAVARRGGDPLSSYPVTRPG